MAVKKFIELYDENGEVKKYHAPAFIKGSVARKGFNLGKEFQKLEQFTAEEFEDGIDAREVITVAMEQLGGILGDEGKTMK